MYTTGDKLLNVMKEEEIGIAELARISGVPERIILDIMAGVKEPELGAMCKIAEGLGICVHELRADEESYAVSVPKDTLVRSKDTSQHFYGCRFPSAICTYKSHNITCLNGKRNVIYSSCKRIFFCNKVFDRVVPNGTFFYFIAFC